MRRILMLLSVAAMLGAAMALSGVAQAAPVGGKADAKCLAEANKRLGPGFKPSDYTFIGGTEGDDVHARIGTAGPDVFCGFGGTNYVSNLDAGDIFLGGAGSDFILHNRGTFYGGSGDDDVDFNYGTFYGEEGDDMVFLYNYGTFYGGPGLDFVVEGPDAVDEP